MKILNSYKILYENESLRRRLSYYLRRMATLLVLEIQFFQGASLLGGPLFLLLRRLSEKVKMISETLVGRKILELVK